MLSFYIKLVEEMVKIGKKIKDFSILLTGNKQARLVDYQNNYLVLYFYPKASTPGCTTESGDFTELLPQFKGANTNILGVSIDSLKRQENFKTKYNFTFDLIADIDALVCNYFGVIQEKKNFGKTYMGIVRSTFIIDPQGILIKQWLKVRVKGHAQEVLEYIITVTSKK
ncbi:MAG: peroxiredoxin [Proteobacteria bacterium]|nr:peroxiredoxin [Pseudomonadota bacterium]